MKNKFLMILLCGVMVVGLTGCGDKTTENQDSSKENQNNVVETKNTVLSCTMIEQGDKELSIPSLNKTEEYTYNDNMILSNIKIIEKIEGTTENVKELEEEYNKGGISISVKNEDGYTIVTRSYDINNIDDKENVLGIDDYIDYSTNKFSAQEYKKHFLEINKNRQATCEEK